jgi:hypothetical protein
MTVSLSNGGLLDGGGDLVEQPEYVAALTREQAFRWDLDLEDDCLLEVLQKLLEPGRSRDVGWTPGAKSVVFAPGGFAELRQLRLHNDVRGANQGGVAGSEAACQGKQSCRSILLFIPHFHRPPFLVAGA